MHHLLIAGVLHIFPFDFGRRAMEISGLPTDWPSAQQAFCVVKAATPGYKQECWPHPNMAVSLAASLALPLSDLWIFPCDRLIYPL